MNPKRAFCLAILAVLSASPAWAGGCAPRDDRGGYECADLQPLWIVEDRNRTRPLLMHRPPTERAAK